MAHFAEIDDNNIVLRVIVVHNNELLDGDGVEQESKGIDFCKNLLSGNWVQTSYNSKFRTHYAGEGLTYDKDNNVFIPPKPFNSWVLNTTSWIYEAPVSYPDDGEDYYWNEDTTAWVKS